MSILNKFISINHREKIEKVLKHKHFYKSFLILSLVFLVLSQSEKPKQKKLPSLDTHIPLGHVLIPIEVQNYKSLDRVLGQYGVVDLYQTSSSGTNYGQLVAQRIKILRSPKDPNSFAVLAPDNQASEIVQKTGPFTVVIQNPKKNGIQIVIKKKIKRIFIGD